VVLLGLRMRELEKAMDKVVGNWETEFEDWRFAGALGILWWMV
jgi:hypothetical protein